ncbi:DEAD/DEAH box helicase family protein [Paenibacillus sp. Marseille-Q4541]|uniref:DEAD/DEAH box helicase family protein n=1 Tax=Paenibacillus sp. Marseille-Q4541 TaxID=2831522 RepID=UPI001BAE1D96|nr:DEAD/DEAH box helicase family protein [Paenibacillus sp. Marseille-Q4541]
MPDIRLITENLADELIEGIGRASGIYIMTSFVMDSGVKLLAPHLEKAIRRGAEVKLLAGDYLHITQPNALRRLLQIEGLELRIWRSRGTSFHPKAYLLDYDSDEGLFIVGSSNMSSSAYKMGFEWNLAMSAQAEPYTFQEALEKFMNSFYHEQTEPVNIETILIYEQQYQEYRDKYPEMTAMVSRMEESELTPMTPEELSSDVMDRDESASVKQEERPMLIPRPAQAMALEELGRTIEEGYDRAITIMPTGLGKTYLAAFFAERFKRVLFIAHREELLHQARRTFKHVMPERSTGLYDGKTKEADKDMVFASIYTLGRKRHRDVFREQSFDLIVVDEFHHAAADTYQAVLQELKTSFLLGVTATPDRMDGKDIYALCDGNVAFSMHFIEAIERGWLSKFHYYGVYDAIDYSKVSWLGTKYDEQELLTEQLQDDVVQRIYQAWLENKLTRTIAFCSSIVQADYLTALFRKQGHQAISLHSNTKEISRPDAIQQLGSGELELIFTVDLFNEGVDIPAVDTLLFVRPTESLTVFTQQVGRGLRTHKGKEVCHIIDLIGNYRNADLKLSLFSPPGAEENSKKKKETFLPAVPEGCSLEFDLQAINLLKELHLKRQPLKEKLHSAYLDVKQQLGRRPSYVELHLHGGMNSKQYRQQFGSYVGMLSWAEELMDEEQLVYEKYKNWLEEVENTNMSKSYKMVILLAMLDRGIEKWNESITAEEAAPFFYHYLMNKEYRKLKDFSDKKTRKLWDYDSDKIGQLISDMPMSKWAGSAKGLIDYDGVHFVVHLDLQEAPVETLEVLYQWTWEIAQYRLAVYFERNHTLVS